MVLFHNIVILKICVPFSGRIIVIDRSELCCAIIGINPILIYSGSENRMFNYFSI